MDKKKLSKNMSHAGRNEALFGVLFDCSPDGIIIFCEDGSIADVNAAACRIYKYKHDEMLSLTAPNLIFGKSMALFEQFKAEIRARKSYMNETVDHDREGNIFSAEICGVAGTYEGNTYFLAIVRDITDRKRIYEKLEYMAHYDILTGLPNRVFFYNRIAHSIAFAKREQSRFALLFLDIDGFKDVNDLYGHNIGDMVLQGIADRLRATIRESDIIARIGGDEIAVVLSKITGPDDASLVARKIVEAIDSQFEFENIVCRVGVSIGIALYPDDGKDTETLLKKADIAMYKVKDGGKNNYQFFSSGIK